LCFKDKKSGRVEEETNELDYLKGLNDYHDSWSLSEPNVVIINCEEEFENDAVKHNWTINQIKSKLDLITSENNDKNDKNNKIEIESQIVADNKSSLRKNIVLEDM